MFAFVWTRLADIVEANESTLWKGEGFTLRGDSGDSGSVKKSGFSIEFVGEVGLVPPNNCEMIDSEGFRARGVGGPFRTLTFGGLGFSGFGGGASTLTGVSAFSGIAFFGDIVSGSFFTGTGGFSVISIFTAGVGCGCVITGGCTSGAFCGCGCC